MKLPKILGAGLFALTVGFAGVAHADIITTTYTGVVTDGGYDPLNGGSFSAPNPYVGQSITETFVVDSSVAYGSYTPTEGLLYGGPGYGSPIEGSLTITIGSNSYSGTGTYWQVETCCGYSYDYGNGPKNLLANWVNIDNGFDPFINAFGGQVVVFANYGYDLSNYGSPLTYTLQSGDASIGSFSVAVDSGFVVGGIAVSSISINEGSSDVPAPASLALLGLGLIGIGGMRKKAKAA